MTRKLTNSNENVERKIYVANFLWKWRQKTYLAFSDTNAGYIMFSH
jgi:hypothetical protein